MSVIHVLEVRYATTKDGPWTEAQEKQVTTDPPHDWTPVRIAASGDVARNFIQARIVPYVRLDNRPGTEPPPVGKLVLGYWGYDITKFAVCHWDDSRGWRDARGEVKPPDWYTALPPAEEQHR